MMRLAILMAGAAALAGCSTAPGSGWSRASDLSVYSSAHAYARVAWEQAVLCQGTDRARATASFEREFGAREAAVRAALVERHGEAALAQAGTHFVQRVPCGDVPDPQWRARYARLLRLLEIRLGLS
ncbi:MAG: hypothetical protein QOJ53_2308 [Sphingomonadales bacterium]|jgi:hypothetical protein|nr:hypothetical protein [Sphingomonadales bacterium]